MSETVLELAGLTKVYNRGKPTEVAVLAVSTRLTRFASCLRSSLIR